jgi:probable rRNA maturation factor
MIEINNLTTLKIEEDFLRKIAGEVLKKEGKENSELSLVLTGQGRIKGLNKKYRGKNKITDVLSFSSSRFFPVSGEKTEKLGEIAICLKEVKKKAGRYGLSFEKQIARTLIHGILHLLGYEHEKSVKEAEKMKIKEDQYLAKIFQSSETNS